MAPPTDPSIKAERMIGRCEMFDEIACGGMATIHLGRMLGAGTFQRTVAIKRLHPQFARDPEFVTMFLDEARIVARIRHPNVIPTIDLVEEAGDLFIIMEYVEGIAFAQLMKLARKRGERVPPPVAVRIMHGALHGLHAAHDATDEKGRPLGLVHRDVSPDNILVGTDGFPRVLDFGVARARNRQSTTRDDRVKGKLAYMAPEQVMGEELDHRTDVFAASVCLWQALTGRRLFKADHMIELAHKVLNQEILPPTAVASDLPKRWDAIVMRGLERPIGKRWRDALGMAEALEAVGGMANNREVGLWVRRIGSDRLSELAAKVKALETKAIAEPAPLKRRVHQRSQLHIDRAELERAVREAQQSINRAEPPIDEPKVVGPPAPEDTGEIALPGSAPGGVTRDRPRRPRTATRVGLGGVTDGLDPVQPAPLPLGIARSAPGPAAAAAGDPASSRGAPRPKGPPPLSVERAAAAAKTPPAGASPAPPGPDDLLRAERPTLRPATAPSTPGAAVVDITPEALASSSPGDPAPAPESRPAPESAPPLAPRGRQASLPGLAHTGTGIHLRATRHGLWIGAAAGGAVAGLLVLGLIYWGVGGPGPSVSATGEPAATAVADMATAALPSAEPTATPAPSAAAAIEPTASPSTDESAAPSETQAPAPPPSPKPTGASRRPTGSKPTGTKTTTKPPGGLYGRQ